MNLTTCSNSLVSALVEMLTWASRKGRLEEADRLLSALHLMRPNFAELNAYDAWLLIRRNRMADAAQLLRQLEGRELQPPFGPYVTALLAVCLSSLGDPSWRIYANQVVTRDEDAESVALVGLLAGKGTKTRDEETTSNESGGPTIAALPYSYMRA